MFIDYTSKVVEEYHKKVASDALSIRLIQPTPASLKKECAAVLNKGLQRKDERVLSDFFGPEADVTAYIKTIEKFEVDKFRPLLNFIKGKINNPDPKNVELLAWLIGFEPRPFKIGRSYQADVPNNIEGAETADAGDNHERAFEEENADDKASTTPPGKGNHQRQRKRRLLATALILLILGVVGYKLWDTYTQPQEACMYWTGDRYKPVSCNSKMADSVLVIPLDPEILRNFKRITKSDTITHYSVGKVWYAKRNGDCEFYTAGGTHPIDSQVKLRPLSRYIVNNQLVQPID